MAIQEAIPIEEEAIRLSPRDPYIAIFYFRIGEAHLLQSHIDEAIRWLERARVAAPALLFVVAYLASAYALNGDTQRAAAALAEVKPLPWSIAGLKSNSPYEDSAIRALFEATVLAGFRKAGLPEE